MRKYLKICSNFCKNKEFKVKLKNSFKDQAVSSIDGQSPVNNSTSNESRPQTADRLVKTQSKHYISGMLW